MKLFKTGVRALGVLCISQFAFGVTPAPAQDMGTFRISDSQRLDTLRVDIKTECVDDTAIFRVFNKGEKWPKSGYVTTFFTDGEKKISRRKVRMTGGQSATFKVKASKFGVGEVGLWVEPTWYERGFKFDAKVDCQ